MTNQLFHDYLDNKIPGHETPTMVWVDIMPQIRPGFYFLPTLADRTAPTMAELNAGVDISHVVTIDGYSPTPWPHMAPEAAAREEERQARNAAIAEAAAAAGRSFADMEAALMAMGEAARRFEAPKYVMPAPPYPIGNIATQKRRKRL